MFGPTEFDRGSLPVRAAHEIEEPAVRLGTVDEPTSCATSSNRALVDPAGDLVSLLETVCTALSFPADELTGDELPSERTARTRDGGPGRPVWHPAEGVSRIGRRQRAR